MEWIAGKRDWRQFWRFKDQLGQGTAYLSKVMTDPVLAEEWAKLPVSPSKGPSLRGYTPTHAKLDDLQDQIIALRGVMGSSSAAELKFTERPVPAYVEVRERNARDAARATRKSVLSALLPGQEV